MLLCGAGGEGSAADVWLGATTAPISSAKALTRKRRARIILSLTGPLLIIFGLVLLAVGFRQKVLRALALRPGRQQLLGALRLPDRLSVIGLCHVLLGERQRSHTDIALAAIDDRQRAPGIGIVALV